MAEKNEYLQEAYQELLKLSADDVKRMEYEAREKAVRDYNCQIKSATAQGIEDGIKIGEARGVKVGEERGEIKIIEKMKKSGMSLEQIAEILEESVEGLEKILSVDLKK